MTLRLGNVSLPRVGHLSLCSHAQILVFQMIPAFWEETPSKVTLSPVATPFSKNAQLQAAPSHRQLMVNGATGFKAPKEKI